MKISWKKQKLHLKETFSISYGNYDFRDALLISLSHHQQHGYGECVAISYYGIDLEAFIAKLNQIRERVERQNVMHPTQFYEFLLTLDLHSFLRSALDCAFWDLYGKLENKPFHEINHLTTTTLPDSSYTVSIDTVENQIKKIERSDWQKFKVKLHGLDEGTIFSLFKTGKEIALDSNTSFTDDHCKFLQNNLLSQQFSYVEQPRPVGEYKVLDRNLNVSWMADEDCQDISYLKKLESHYSSINVKLMKCGGIMPALSLIMEAKKMGYQVMIGCMTESSVGISAGIAVAALCDFADLDGANLISNDYAEGSFVKKGRLMLSEKPGLGISLKENL